MAITLDGTNGINSSGVIVAPDGSASAPAITNDGDTNTGIFFPAADTIAFGEGGAEAMRINSSGNVGIGTTSPTTLLDLYSASGVHLRLANSTTGTATGDGSRIYASGNDLLLVNRESATMQFYTADTERARITSAGSLLVGTTTVYDSSQFTLETTAQSGANSNGLGIRYVRSDAGGAPVIIDRINADGTLISFSQAGASEGSISVSGSTVSYNGGHLSRWAQLTTPKDDTPLFKGTVMSNLDEMNVYVDADGNPVENEQLNKVKVSDVEGDVNVAGVFVNWDYDEAHQVDEINMAMTGDMIIRIAQGVAVARGDLLMSAGDGTAKPQGDDIVRSKTIAKVTSTHVTCTYDDGSYCVPCVLMAC
jgi:hypothetical protein